jgi:GTPase SAR1 family protein
MKREEKSKLICIIGAPSSGKSTLATSVHHSLKVRGENSIFVGEAATDYIAEWGIPDTPLDQIVIFYISHVNGTIFKTILYVWIILKYLWHLR